MNSESILITGGCGFVGSSIALKLRLDYPQAKITVLDNLIRKGSELNIPKMKENDIQFIQGDVRNPSDLLKAGEISILIDAAAEPSVLSGIDSTPDYVINTNLNGTINCLNYARMNKAKFVFLSTSRVYPIEQLSKVNYSESESRFLLDKHQNVQGVSEKGIAENFSLEGARSFYGTSKLSSEMFIQEYAEFYGMKSIVNRFGVIAGPFQMGKIDQGVVVFWMARHYWKGELSYIGFGGLGKQVRDILHIDDLYRLLRMQLNNFDKFNGKIFNVGGGLDISVSLKELSEICANITGNRININSIKENRSADIPIYITDNSKINLISDWRPQKMVNDILTDIFQWIQKDEAKIKFFLN